MNIRKNQNSLDSGEKSRLVSAFLALKNKVPSQMGLKNRYDDYVQMHMDSMEAATSEEPGWAHMGPAFCPWHRMYLHNFEMDLQAVDPLVTLPYWDWTTDNSPTSSIWDADLLGGDGRSSDARVMTGGFAYDAGNWTINIQDPDDTQPGPDLRRQLAKFPGVTQLPTADQVKGCLEQVPYYVSPWKAFSDFSNMKGPVQPSFCNRLEGWYGLGSIHNRVHLWVGGQVGNIQGTMLLMTSPNDPAFWLHHANIDRLWAQWQAANPTQGYHPDGSASETGPPGHNLNDAMHPWNTATIATVLDHTSLGYSYDTDSPEQIEAAGKVKRTVFPAMAVPKRAAARAPMGGALEGMHMHTGTMFRLSAEDLSSEDGHSGHHPH